MGKKSSKAPAPDPNIGIAAKMSAKTGEEYLRFMKEQSAITNQWAEEDRTRERTVFRPLQDQYIAEAQRGPDYSKVADDVRRAQTDITHKFDGAQGQQERRMASMGVNPASGRFQGATRSSELAEAAATAGAGNATRLASRGAAEAKSEQAKANAINMGSGLAVNPATSMGLSNAAAGAGFSGAIQGYGQQGDMLNKQYNNQLQAWQAQNAADSAASSSLWGGIGSLAGLALSSSKDVKENKKPVSRSLLKAVENMPVEEWDYKAGEGDGGRHVGAYAEDFQRETGQGDGKSINLVDAIGTTMGAIKELSAKVDQIAAPKQRSIKRRAA